MQISVIIPVYNCEKYIEQAVASVLSQPLKNINIVIIDDGSTDSSPKVCDDLALNHERVTVIHTENGGVSKARNIGIDYVLSKTDSDYIAFLDADDLYAKDFFNEEISALLEEKHELLCFTNVRCTNDLRFCSAPIKIKEGAFIGGASSVRIHDDASFAAALFSSDLLRRTGIRFFEDIKYAEDKIFIMQCLYTAETIVQKEMVIYLYRSNPFSEMSKSYFGIEYFLPMIKAYIKSDELMLRFKNEKRDELFWGRTLGALYTVEMAQSQVGHDLSFKKVEAVLKENRDVVQNLEFFSDRISETAKALLNLYKTQRGIFLFKSAVICFKAKIRKTLKKFKVVRVLLIKKKYKFNNRYI
ncbi:MAG: glycosyltransferase family 2 protein [Clostridia bacterium]|nr:glycosyltransferase family 2 protein [Clostridia bacterium]